eukprot:GAHX01005486.1.p3 GENE.GAHX01005486.1~~GAHX01005486.1.p3  ORF type:complete len:54 (-),score=8.86 GAHX01005486.1:74-235(-)
MKVTARNSSLVLEGLEKHVEYEEITLKHSVVTPEVRKKLEFSKQLNAPFRKVQ